jgi:glucosamine--fructose-6-phosphate aminotransferase (isomerizing)
MLAEILEQPVALERTLRRTLAKARRFRETLRKRDIRMVILVARGTSDNAATFGRYLIEITTGLPVSLAAPSIHTVYKTNLRLSNTLVVGISQSGAGPDINQVLESSRQRGALTLGITNEPDSPMTKAVDECWLVHAGKERSVAATKTYTGQLLLLYLLAWSLGAPIGAKALERIPDHASRTLRLQPQIEELVDRYRFMNHAIVVGRGLNYANAFELALKLMETCYVVTERFSSADFLHGPIALVQADFPVFVFAPPGPTSDQQKSLLERLGGLHADTLVFTERSFAGHSTKRIVIPHTGSSADPEDLYTPIPYIIPGQLFTACLAAAKGINPDAPRQLAKVTQTI